MSKRRKKRKNSAQTERRVTTNVNQKATLINRFTDQLNMETPSTNPINTQLATESGFNNADWLVYYSQVREFQAAVATKFVNMLTQICAFSAAVMAALGALLDKVNHDKTALFMIAACASIPILISWIFLYSYRHQIKGSGTILLKLELALKIPKEAGLIQTLRERPYVFYNAFRADLVTHGTPPALVGMLLVSAHVFSRLEPSARDQHLPKEVILQTDKTGDSGKLPGTDLQNPVTTPVTQPSDHTKQFNK